MCSIESFLFHSLQNTSEGDDCPTGMIYITDIDRRNTNTTNESSKHIPKVVYQTSKSRCMHPNFVEFLNIWRDHDNFPGYSHFLYDDEAMDNFLYDKERWENEFPSLNLALQCINEVDNPDLMTAMRMQLGLMGIIYRVQLKVT